MARITIIFSKSNGARYLSHLDLMATLEFSIRRARLPVELSEGFNPRPRMSLAAPLPLGYVGEQEILEIALRHSVTPEEVQHRLQAAVPPGITIRSVVPAAEGVKSSASRVRGATYRVQLGEDVNDLGERVAKVLRQTQIEVTEERDGQERRRNIRPLIISLEAVDFRLLRLRVHLDSSGTARPEQLLTALSLPSEGARIVRESLELAD
jgi:radical SAM-linked protein